MTPHNSLQRIVELFLRGKLSGLLIILSLAAGAIALMATPREEEPQIVVPLADVFVSVPGATAAEVERQVTTPLEKFVSQIDGVEYVYSMSRPGSSIVTVRFFVGQNREDSLIKLHNNLAMHADAVPAMVQGWVVKPVEIDDVPIFTATLHAAPTSGLTSGGELRRIAQEIQLRLQAVPDTGPTAVLGGQPLVASVHPDPQQLASRGLSISNLQRALAAANINLPAGQFSRDNQRFIVEAGSTLTDVRDLENLVIAVADNRPVYLRDVASINLAPDEVTTYTRFYSHASPAPQSAVTVTVAKKKGSNAVWVAQALHDELARLAPVLLPHGVSYTVTRDYGQTANHKVNELVESLAVAILIVVALLAYALGMREALIVAVAVPITFGLTLLINYLTGYSINRVTLFALILALGLVVDDPIVDVENIHRHLTFKHHKNPFDAVLAAVNEVRPPIILATLAVIVSFLPMFFITGMMGPYMRPMALNVPLAMLMSMVVAFTITPWMSRHLLKPHDPAGADHAEVPLTATPIYRLYAAAMRPLLDRRTFAWGLLAATSVLFVLACLLPLTGRVPLKMLPFDNKNEFQLVIDMPESATLEATAAVTDELARYLVSVNEVTNLTTYVGHASPMDFNGLVRHHYLRQAPNLAEIRVNLLEKRSRAQQSHEIILRLRDDLTAIAHRHSANLQLVEQPPGPPVIATLTAELYGPNTASYADLQAVARKVEARFNQQPGVVDVDSTVEDPVTRLSFHTDDEKANLAGLSDAQISADLQSWLSGVTPTYLHNPRELSPLPVILRLPESARSSPDALLNLYFPTASAVSAPGSAGGYAGSGATSGVQLRELGRFESTTYDQTIYHKNLRPIAYIFAENAGIAPVDAILAMHNDLKSGAGIVPAGFNLVWTGEGEWKITVDAFRDLGLAFAAACLGIYILLVYETNSYAMPLILMVSIPLTILGIMPGFWLLNLLLNHPINGYANPVFFTATAMIGMIALAGIAVRNAILLIDFIHASQRDGQSLRDAILQSGAVRFRPILLTAGTALLAAWPITLDPIFSGLAWALIFGLFVSTAFTLLVIPTIYWLIYHHRPTATLTASS